MLLGNPISDSLITIVMLGNFTHERAGFALVFLAWSKRYFFLCNEDGWIRESCRIGGSEWLSKLFKYFKLNSLRMKFGLVDYKFVI